VSIDDVMAEAGLTRGSFYCYFSSKSDLYAQSVARIVHEDPETTNGSGSGGITADKIVRDYLSDQDPQATDETLPMIGLPKRFAHRSRGQAGIRNRAQSNDRSVRKSNERQSPNEANSMPSPLPRFAWAAWFFPDRSTTKASAVSCARLIKRPHSSLVSG